MIPEDAYFHMILLQTGHTDIYDSHLNTYLQKEDPLSDIVLSLSFCDTLDKTIGCLYDYTIDKKMNMKSLLSRGKCVFRNKFLHNRRNCA